MSVEVVRGLTAAEVAERVARGEVNDVPAAPTRTVAEIVRANVLTRFNALVTTLFVVIAVVGPLKDGLFFGVVIANSVVGVVQELRAKRTLDRLAVLAAPAARVLRDGETLDVAMTEVVLDDVLVLRAGDQVTVDAVVVRSDALELDEGLLTGEADPIVKELDDEVLSGSFVVAGSGLARASRVGADAYAARLAEDARRFTLTRSELRRGIDRIVTYASWAMGPTAVALLVSQLLNHDDREESIRTTVGAMVAMVPEGLVLLTSVAFAAGVVRLANQKVLVQELPAVEMLARVDVLCVDKTGTITTGEISFRGVEPAEATDAAAEQVERALSALVGAEDHPNATLAAIGRSIAGRAVTVSRSVPFSSARKWSGIQVADEGSYVLGAPDVLLAGGAPLRERAEALGAQGARVVLVAGSSAPLEGEALPGDLSPLGLVVLEDTIRAEAPATFAFFTAEGVTVKVISGDQPATVAAVARRAEVPGADRSRDARELPEDPEALAAALAAATVFGRVTPQQKRAMVEALRGAGHVVAMTGDGVNDVLALKEADCGVAMGSGSAATKAVAQLVLLDDGFEHLPPAVAEGRRAIANVERVARLFVTKTVYSVLLALAIAVAGLPFPFLPRHLTLVGTLTIGVPAFFLALGPASERARGGYVERVLRWAVPAGAVAAVATFCGYALARSRTDVSLAEARTMATLVLCMYCLTLVVRLARPLTVPKQLLVGSMAAGYVIAITWPPVRDFFELDPPPAPLLAVALGLVALASVGFGVLLRSSEPRAPGPTSAGSPG